jgi:hypothetical protein
MVNAREKLKVVGSDLVDHWTIQHSIKKHFHTFLEKENEIIARQ